MYHGDAQRDTALYLFGMRTKYSISGMLKTMNFVCRVPDLESVNIEGKFVILATDLSLSYGMPYQYENSWEKVSRNGSKCLVMWQSDDLIHWTDQKMVRLGDEHFGCLRAPDIIYDPKESFFTPRRTADPSSTPLCTRKTEAITAS